MRASCSQISGQLSAEDRPESSETCGKYQVCHRTSLIAQFPHSYLGHTSPRQLGLWLSPRTIRLSRFRVGNLCFVGLRSVRRQLQEPTFMCNIKIHIFREILPSCQLQPSSCMQTTPCPEKNIPNIIDCHLKNGYPILITFSVNISSTIGHQMSVQYSTSPNVCFCKTEPTKYELKWTKIR